MGKSRAVAFLVASFLLLAASAAGQMQMPTAPAAALTGCFADPTAASCANFAMSDADVAADLIDLCSTPGASMPYMVVCSLKNACEGGKASGPYCAPFSLLATGCVDMPRMSGCKRYNALCNPPASTVQQCKASAPVPKALTTKEARDAISEMCGDHFMEGCDTCKGTGYAQCPNPFDTLANICWGMSAMEGCTPFFSMCEGLETGFPSLCTATAAGA